MNWWQPNVQMTKLARGVLLECMVLPEAVLKLNLTVITLLHWDTIKLTLWNHIALWPWQRTPFKKYVPPSFHFQYPLDPEFRVRGVRWSLCQLYSGKQKIHPGQEKWSQWSLCSPCLSSYCFIALLSPFFIELVQKIVSLPGRNMLKSPGQLIQNCVELLILHVLKIGVNGITGGAIEYKSMSLERKTWEDFFSLL